MSTFARSSALGVSCHPGRQNKVSIDMYWISRRAASSTASVLYTSHSKRPVRNLQLIVLTLPEPGTRLCQRRSDGQWRRNRIGEAARKKRENQWTYHCFRRPIFCIFHARHHAKGVSKSTDHPTWLSKSSNGRGVFQRALDTQVRTLTMAVRDKKRIQTA